MARETVYNCIYFCMSFVYLFLQLMVNEIKQKINMNDKCNRGLIKFPLIAFVRVTTSIYFFNPAHHSLLINSLHSLKEVHFLDKHV